MESVFFIFFLFISARAEVFLKCTHGEKCMHNNLRSGGGVSSGLIQKERIISASAEVFH